MEAVGSKWGGRAAKVGFVLAVIAMVAGGVALLNVRAGAGVAAVEPPVLGVSEVRVDREPGYSEIRAYAGRIEPAREVSLGFERAGRIEAVLAEEGAAVAAGQAVARLDTAELEAERDRLEAVLRQQAAAVELARLTDERQRGLTDRASSAQARDAARLALVEVEARAAETEALLARLAIDIEKSVLRAPFAGRVAARWADEGAIVAAGSPVLGLMEARRPQARIGLPPEVATKLDPGAAYRVEVEDRPFPARLLAVRPDIDPASRTVPALFALDGGEAAGFGRVAVLALDTPVAAPGFWMPLGALVEGSRGTWTVLTLAHEGGERVVTREAVEVLTVAGERAFVASPLADGTAVVAAGTHRVRPGQRMPLLVAGH